MKQLKEKLVCPICGVERKMLGAHMIRVHGLTTEETKIKFGLESLTAPATLYKMTGKNNHFYGKHHTDESKDQMIMNRDGKHFGESEMPKCKICGKILTSKGATYCRKHCGILMLGDDNPSSRPEVRQKLRDNWKNVEFVRWMMKKRHAKPNKQEQRLDETLQEITFGEYQINVTADIMTLGSKIPDFVNVNGQKKVIELFGDYWHGEKFTGRTKEEEEQQRIDCFAQAGYQTLIVWQHELKNLDLLIEKITCFHNM